jgi:hypothetical protein
VYPAALMLAYPIDIRIGSARSNDAGLIAPLARASCWCDARWLDCR